jgi:hypothetical protein
MGVETTSAGESVLKLGQTTQPGASLKQSQQFSATNKENSVHLEKIILSQGGKRDMHHTMANFNTLSSQGRDSEAEAKALEDARKGIKTNAIGTRTLKNKLNQNATRRSQIMPNTNISPGHNAKKHQVSSPIYDISHDSSQPVKETTTSLNQTLTLQQ